MRRTQKNREILTRLVQREVKRQLGVLGMATRDEVARLQQRVRALEQEIERSSGAASSARRATRSASAGSGTTRGSTRATRGASAGSGTTRSSTRASKAKAAGSGTAKPSTRTRTAGAGTRRTRGAAGSTPPESAPPSDTPPASTPE
jgi:uncharacterized small protein (DUF1192 family)